MKSQLIPIPTDMLLTVLDIIKGVKSEYVSIPRMITKVPIMSNMVCGTSDNAICHIASLSNLYEINGLINKYSYYVKRNQSIHKNYYRLY